MYQTKFDLEHFIFVVARCVQCGDFITSKTFAKEDLKNEAHS